MEEGAADGKSGIKTCTSEGINFAECPKHEADRRGDPESHVRRARVLASDVKDVEHEDASANYLHVERCPAFAEHNVAILDTVRNRCW